MGVSAKTKLLCKEVVVIFILFYKFEVINQELFWMLRSSVLVNYCEIEAATRSNDAESRDDGVKGESDTQTYIIISY